MRLFLVVVFVFMTSQSVLSQIDRNEDRVPSELKTPVLKFDQNSSANSSPYKSSYKPTGIHSLTSPKYRTGFANPTDFILKKQQKPLTMTRGHGLKERLIHFEPNYLGETRDSGGVGNQKTQNLGEFFASGKFIEIYCRDHEYVDGDKVRIMINGEVVARSLTLMGNFQPVLVSLKKGVNLIEITALNVGTSAPNTAQFIVYDEDGRIITKNTWNLSTGVSARMVIRKP